MTEQKNLIEYQAEYTDTFGGEANYSWVTRISFWAPDTASDRMLIRRAKAAMGLSGVRGKTTNFSTMLEFRPHGMATVMFVTASA